MAVRASSISPGRIQPVMINDREYVDGGLLSQVPVRVVRQLGADVFKNRSIQRGYDLPLQ